MGYSIRSRACALLAALVLVHCASGSTGDGVEGGAGSSGGTTSGGSGSGSGSGSGASSSGSASSGSGSGSGSSSSSGGRDSSTADSTVDAPGDAPGSGDATVDGPGGGDGGSGGDDAGDATGPGDATTPGDSTAADAPPDAPADAGAEAGDGGTAPLDASGPADSSPPVEAGAEASSCAIDNQFPQSTFVSLAVTPGAALNTGENDALPGDGGAAPAGWNFYQISGAVCRDGSPTGFYVHYGTAQKLFIYLEGGGACSSATFCTHNPASMTQSFAGGAPTQGQTIGGSLGAFSTTPQAPYLPTTGVSAYSPGIFDFTNAANPVKDWSGVYVPYCTGDVHFGTNDSGTVPGDGLLPALTGQHFVGYRNMQKFIARIVPTFPNVTQVLLTGASAGGFGAGLNLGMVQDSFGSSVPVTVLDDSGPPFRIQYLPACAQQQWRTLWGLDTSLPSDCQECFRSDGSGLMDIVTYWRHKYRNAKVGLVSTMQDEVMRLFFAQGNGSCASNNATNLAAAQVLGGYTGAEYTQGLNDLLTTYACTGALAAYYIGGQNSAFPNPTYHQHIFRQEFYQATTNDGGVTMAQWTANLLSGNLQIVGP
jgi:hypothetical protein